MTVAQTNDHKSQSDKFKDAAREHGANESEDAWNRRLKKVVKHKPVEKPE